MKRYLALLIAFSTSTLAVAPALCTDVPSIDLLKSQADDLVHSLQAAELWVGGGVVVTNGIDTKVTSYGTRSPESDQVPTGSSHYEIGSISKSFTGILLAWTTTRYQQVHLDDPIKNFLPELQGYFSGDMTLRGLATHTSGLNADFCVGKVPNKKCYLNPSDVNDPWADFSESELTGFLKAFTSADVAPPHTYSNPGFITLGYVLSRITGKSYQELLDDVITGPLHMSDTFVNQPGVAVSDYMPGFNVIELEQKHWEFDLLSAPTGGIISTADDMAKYLQANVNPPDSALGRAIKLSQRNGLGWDSAPGDAVIWKNGGTGGFSSFISIDPAKHEGWTALSNMACVYSGDYFPNFAIFGGVRPDVFGLILPDATLNRFVGSYSSGGQDAPVTITKPGHFLRFNGGDTTSDFRLQALSANDFATTDNENYIGFNKVSFQQDPQGRVSGFIFHLNDGKGNYTDYSFKKIN